jgi:hypothetical protein
VSNAQKAQRLEEIAAEMEHADNGAADAALLRESAAMWRERGDDESAQWDEVLRAALQTRL